MEPAYVVAASQVVRFYVRPIDKAALDKDSQKKKPRAAPVAIDASQKKMDEERERIKREEKADGPTPAAHRQGQPLKQARGCARASSEMRPSSAPILGTAEKRPSL